MDYDTSPGHGNKEPWEVMTPTLWSVLLWALGVYCVVQMFKAIGVHKRAIRAHQAEQARLAHRHAEQLSR